MFLGEEACRDVLMEMETPMSPSLYHPACVLNLKRKIALSFIYRNESALYLLRFNVSYVVIVFEPLVYDFTKKCTKSLKIGSRDLSWSSSAMVLNLWVTTSLVTYWIFTL